MRRVVAVAAFLLVAVSAGVCQDRIAFYGGSAGHLYDSCKAVEKSDDQVHGVEALDLTFCYGYIEAAASMENMWRGMDAHDCGKCRIVHACLPLNAETKQLIRVFNKYASDHPEDLNQSAINVLRDSFIKAFPCN